MSNGSSVRVYIEYLGDSFVHVKGIIKDMRGEYCVLVMKGPFLGLRLRFAARCLLGRLRQIEKINQELKS